MKDTQKRIDVRLLLSAGLLMGLLLILGAGLLLNAATTQAQNEPPEIINRALEDIGRYLNLGFTPTLDDLDAWRWTQQEFVDNTLNCGGEPTRGFVRGYIFSMTYRGVFFDYRATTDGQTFFLCNTPDVTRLRPTETPTPLPTNTATNTPLPTATLPPTATPLAQPTVQTGGGGGGGGTTGGGGGGGGSSNVVIASPFPQEGFRPCPDALTGVVPSRMGVGLEGRFIGAQALNVRSEPSRLSEPIGVMNPNATFTVVDGPGCDPTFTWWQVDLSGVVGWIPEVDPSNLSYWLQPIGGVVAAPTAQADAPAAVEPETETSDAEGETDTESEIEGETESEATESEPQAEAPPADVTFAPITRATARNVIELARQAVNNPLLIRAGSSNAVDDLVIIITANGLLQYSNAASDAALASRQMGETLAAALDPSGERLFTLERVNGALQFNTYGTFQPTGGAAGGGPIELDFSNGMAYLPDLNVLALGGQNAILLLDVESSSVVAELELSANPVGIAANPTGNILAVLLPNDTVEIWDVNTRSRLAALEQPTSSFTLNAISYSPNGARLAVSTGAGVNIWNVTTNQVELSLPVFSGEDGGEVYHIAYSPDASVIATAGGPPLFGESSAEYRIQLWDADTGATLATLPNPTRFITGLAFSADGRLLNTLSQANVWQIWGAPTQ